VAARGLSTGTAIRHGVMEIVVSLFTQLLAPQSLAARITWHALI
jgi:hypothetical protein